jgi:hypothetical protein
MPRMLWPLRGGRPCVEIILVRTSDGQPQVRWLLADTGAAAAHSGFELLMSLADCVMAGGWAVRPTRLGGAYRGVFSTHVVPVEIPILGFADRVAVVAANPPPEFDGIACFPFLNRFTYGNFGDPAAFGLES